jgi:hypothetical protein
MTFVSTVWIILKGRRTAFYSTKILTNEIAFSATFRKGQHANTNKDNAAPVMPASTFWPDSLNGILNNTADIQPEKTVVQSM